MIRARKHRIRICQNRCSALPNVHSCEQKRSRTMVHHGSVYDGKSCEDNLLCRFAVHVPLARSGGLHAPELTIGELRGLLAQAVRRCAAKPTPDRICNSGETWDVPQDKGSRASCPQGACQLSGAASAPVGHLEPTKCKVAFKLTFFLCKFSCKHHLPRTSRPGNAEESTGPLHMTVFRSNGQSSRSLAELMAPIP